MKKRMAAVLAVLCLCLTACGGKEEGGTDGVCDLETASGLEGTAVLWEEFQSTLPVRGATKPGIQRIRIKGISIHAPREGSDSETAQRHRYVL